MIRIKTFIHRSMNVVLISIIRRTSKYGYKKPDVPLKS